MITASVYPARLLVAWPSFDDEDFHAQMLEGWEPNALQENAAALDEMDFTEIIFAWVRGLNRYT